MKKNTIFITGTSTEVGKTYVACKIIRNSIQNGLKISVYKPVISGFENNQDNDLKLLLKAQNKPYTKENIEKISLYIFKEPISPDIASRKNQIEIDVKKIKNFIKNASDITIIEGAGGIMTPINSTQTNLDLIKALKAKAIVITTNYLGMLSHTLSAIKALQTEYIEIESIVINQIHENDLDVSELKKTLGFFYQGQIVLIEKNQEDLSAVKL